MDNRDKFYFFNKVLSSSVPVLFTLWSNYLSEPHKRTGHSKALRVVKTCLHQRRKHKHKCGRNSTRINTNTGESTHLFFLFSPVIHAFKAQVQENQTRSFYSSCACSLILWIGDDQENNDCVPSSHVCAYAFVVDDLTELSCTGLLAFMSLV